MPCSQLVMRRSRSINLALEERGPWVDQIVNPRGQYKRGGRVWIKGRDGPWDGQVIEGCLDSCGTERNLIAVAIRKKVAHLGKHRTDHTGAKAGIRGPHWRRQNYRNPGS